MSLVSGIVGAVMGSNAQEDAAKTQAEATKNASDIQLQMFHEQQAAMKPWTTAGTAAVNQLSAGTAAGGQFATTPQFKFDPSSVDVTKDPGYAFRMQQGQNALTAGSAAAGNYGSGNLGVALQNYGQQLGSQEYGAAYNRAYSSALDQYNAAMTSQNTIFNRLSGIAGTGQTAQTTLGSQGLETANQVGSNTIAGAQAIAQGQIGSTNALVSGMQNASNQAISGYGAYNQAKMYNNYQNALAYNSAPSYSAAGFDLAGSTAATNYGTGLGADSLSYAGYL